MVDKEYNLVVFDLDFTLWDAGGVWCDCLQPPFSKSERGVVDASGAVVRVYDGIVEAMDRLDALGLDLAVASRTEQPDWARRLLELLGLRSRFRWEEIYPSSKLRHFASLQERSGYAYEEMLFLDDERRNIDEVGSLGVEAVWVRGGFRLELLEPYFSWP